MIRMQHHAEPPVAPPLVPVLLPVRLFGLENHIKLLVEEVHVSHPDARVVCTQCSSTVPVVRTQQYHVGTNHHRMVCCDQCTLRKKGSCPP
jgi:hypothetical protein